MHEILAKQESRLGIVDLIKSAGIDGDTGWFAVRRDHDLVMLYVAPSDREGNGRKTLP